MSAIIPAMNTQDKNKEVIRRFYDEVWNKCDLDVADELFEHDYLIPDLPAWRKPGVDGLKEFIADNHRMFPDVHHVIENIVAEGDAVAVFIKGSGTHKGDLNGPVGFVPATGKAVTWRGVLFFKLKDGKVVESKGVIDNMGLMQQLGAVPSPEA